MNRMTELWQKDLEDNGHASLVPVLDKVLTTQEVILEKLTDLNNAFPGSDLDGHRRAHEAMIERTAELKRLRVAIQEKTLSALIWAMLLGLGTAVWRQVIHMLTPGH